MYVIRLCIQILYNICTKSTFQVLPDQLRYDVLIRHVIFYAAVSHYYSSIVK